MAEVTVEASEIKSRAADDRGRVRLGPEFADKDVEVAILDASDDAE